LSKSILMVDGESARVRRLHRLLASLLPYFRSRRMRTFQRMLGITDDTRIIDVGGTPFNWNLIDQTPRVTLLNLDVEEKTVRRFCFKRGDARAIPFPDNFFDVAYSNSVIEHVGGAADWEKFAREIRRIAPAYYVQTPNFWFPIEPHQISLFLHWLPRRLERRLVRYFSLWGWITREPQEEIDRWLSGTILLTKRDMRRLFPDAEIMTERFLCLPKSIIAVRCGDGARDNTP
jgi:Methyltransferase domain